MKKFLKITLATLVGAALSLSFGLVACGDKPCEHTYDNACDVTCNACGEEREAGEHTYDNACDVTCNVCGEEREVSGHGYTELVKDETRHWYKCPICGEEDGENKQKHAGGEATCISKASCSTCDMPYGEVDENAHLWGEVRYTWAEDYSTCTAERACEHNAEHIETETVNSVFADDVYTATFATEGFGTKSKVLVLHAEDMTAEQLNTALLEMLADGERQINIALAPNARTSMITAIRRAICDAEGVEDGSIHLTLAGVTTIPDDGYNYAYENGFVFGPKYITNADGSGYTEYVTELASVSLPDVTSIGKEAFYMCEKLRFVDAPKTTSLGEFAFDGCYSLTKINLPKATTLNRAALDFYSYGVKLVESFVYLTAEGEINVDEDLFDSFEYYSDLSDYVNLILNNDKQSEVTFKSDGTATWSGFTFKSIRFTCVDGAEHTYQAVTANDNGTHGFTCSACDIITEVCYGGEATCTKKAICELCNAEYGEFALHELDQATGYCKMNCGEMVAGVKVFLNGVDTYYEDIDALWGEDGEEGATITLLKDDYGGYIQWHNISYTLDLNGHEFNRGGYELYPTGENAEVVLMNSVSGRGKICSAFAGTELNKFTVGSKVDIQAILIYINSEYDNDLVIDLSNADFASTTIRADGEGLNVSQIILGDYKVYDAEGNVVTGELLANTDYTIKR